jgi:cell division protein FtsQ
VNRYAEINYQGSRGFSSGLLVVLVLFIAAMASMAWVSLGIVAKDRWPIRWLEINGNFQRVSAEQLRAGLTPLISSSFFAIDLQDLRDAADRISWVSDVKVQKKWPDTVMVEVDEYQPFAHWNSGQLISSKGEAFSVPEADGLQGLPWLRGPENRLGQMLDGWTRFNDELVAAGLEIQQLNLDQRGAWSLVLTNGTTVHLGREAAHERLQRLMSSWDVLLQDRTVSPIDVDLRYTNGFAVNWPQQSDELARKDS